ELGPALVAVEHLDDGEGHVVALGLDADADLAGRLDGPLAGERHSGAHAVVVAAALDDQRLELAELLEARGPDALVDQRPRLRLSAGADPGAARQHQPDRTRRTPGSAHGKPHAVDRRMAAPAFRGCPSAFYGTRPGEANEGGRRPEAAKPSGRAGWPPRGLRD